RAADDAALNHHHCAHRHFASLSCQARFFEGGLHENAIGCAGIVHRRQNTTRWCGADSSAAKPAFRATAEELSMCREEYLVSFTTLLALIPPTALKRQQQAAASNQEQSPALPTGQTPGRGASPAIRRG